jgi:glutathione peroxidase
MEELMKKNLFLILLTGLLIGLITLYKGADSMSTDASDCPAALNFVVKSIDGKEVNLCGYKGNVLLIVNTASECGYTPQYKGLEELNQKYRSKGLRILGFPSNDFGGQEPGSEGEIKQFCERNYKVTFDLFSKVTVKGANKVALYKYLTSGGGEQKLSGEVSWNFNKYLIDRDGKLVGRYSSNVEPTSQELTSEIEKLLK